MAKTKSRPAGLRRNSQIGSLAAEQDRKFDNEFYESEDFETLVDVNDARSLVIGRTGSGKSAMLRRLEITRPGKTLRVDPRHLSLQFITDSQVSKLADEFEVNIEPLYTELWKHVIVTEMIKFRYGVSEEAERSVRWSGFLDKLRRDKAKNAAQQYIDRYGDRFWISTEEIVKEKVLETDSRVKEELGASVSAQPFKADGREEVEQTERKQIYIEEKKRFKRIVGENQLSNLDQLIDLLVNDIRDSGSSIYVVIDDLDDDWVDDSMYRQLVMALFRTVRELGRFDGLKIVVAVRNNILRYLDFEEAGTGQREKYDALLVNLRWTRADLEAMLDLRAVRLALELGIGGIEHFDDLLPSSDQGGESAIDFVVSHTLMRPRDAIDLVNKALESGSNDEYIKWESLRKAVRSYSRSRLDAVVDEWKLVYPELRWAIDRFSQASARMNRGQLDNILYDMAIDIDVSTPSKPVEGFSESVAEVDADTAWRGPFRRLVAVLYEVGFLGVNLDPNSPGYVYSFEEPDYFLNVNDVPESGRFEIHRAFHSALGIESYDREAD